MSESCREWGIFDANRLFAAPNRVLGHKPPSQTWVFDWKIEFNPDDQGEWDLLLTKIENFQDALRTLKQAADELDGAMAMKKPEGVLDLRDSIIAELKDQTADLVAKLAAQDSQGWQEARRLKAEIVELNGQVARLSTDLAQEEKHSKDLDFAYGRAIDSAREHLAQFGLIGEDYFQHIIPRVAKELKELRDEQQHCRTNHS